MCTWVPAPTWPRHSLRCGMAFFALQCISFCSCGFLHMKCHHAEANVLSSDVLAFAFLWVKYLSFFAHVVSFSHVASERRSSSYCEHDNGRGDNFAHLSLPLSVLFFYRARRIYDAISRTMQYCIAHDCSKHVQYCTFHNPWSG